MLCDVFWCVFWCTWLKRSCGLLFVLCIVLLSECRTLIVMECIDVLKSVVPSLYTGDGSMGLDRISIQI